jgi:hypothetical protein
LNLISPKTVSGSVERFFAQSDTLLGKQVGFGLLTETVEFKTELHASIAF